MTPTAALPVNSAACSSPRRCLPGHRFVYCLISQRAGGLSVGVNMNPDKRCNFDCVYCEVDRSTAAGPSRVPVRRIIRELRDTLSNIQAGRLADIGFERTPDELLALKKIALSGDGEPTLCPNFQEVVEAVTQLRARRLFRFCKIVLMTNGTGLHLPGVQAGLGFLSSADEVWVKLDAGTQAYLDAICRPEVSITQVLENIALVGKQRPIVVQSLFAKIDGVEPPDYEIEQYVARLKEIKAAGAQIALVQIYSAHRAAVNASCSHLPARSLSQIARRVREATGLKAEIF